MNSPSCGWEGATMTSTITNKQLRQLMTSAAAAASKKSPSRRKKPSRKARRARRAGTQLAGGPPSGGTGRFVDLPAARAYADLNMNRFRVRNVKDKMHGDGILVEGCQALVNVVTAAAAADFFTSSVATADSVNRVRLSPDTFNGRLALQARNYARYRFTQLRLHFVPGLGTANPGLGAVGYVPDGDQNSFATQSFAQTTQMTPSMTFSLNLPVSVECLQGYVRDPTLFYTEQDTNTDAGQRQTCQGMIVGFPSSNSLGVLTQGLLVADYTVELYYPTTDYGFTVTLRSESERDAVRKCIERLRIGPTSEDEEWDRGSHDTSRRRR